MISIEEIKEKQEELNKMIEEYENQKEVKVELMLTWNKNWKPKGTENYYYINEYGEVWNYINEYNTTDEKIIKHNRIFQTKELAKKWLEIDTYLREKSFEPDWNDECNYKYYIVFDCCGNRFYKECCYSSNNLSPFYFETEEIIDEIFKKYTKEELKFYFNIG